MNQKSMTWQNRQPQPIDCRLLYIKKANYPTKPVRELQEHTYTELYFITRGSGEFYIDNTLCPVQTNDLVIVNPNVLHQLLSYTDSQIEAIVIGMDGIFFTPNEFTDMSSSLYLKKSLKDNYKNISFYFKSILHEIKKMEFNYEEVCQNLLEILVTNVVRQTKCTITSTSSARTNKECAFIKRYIDHHFAENINLDSLATMTHMNKYYMVHAFNKYIGYSPINYLIEKRIAESKRLLETTSQSIAQIASTVGFSSQSYFSQVFKKSTGMTPNAYRKSAS
ncbi:MAG: AraC family transcriptional regulator [Lachnospiraceae bacterium]|nr:AraC family transcriptional regulator [Lachnospiraceae bacterium]